MLSSIREKYPQYADLSDEQLAEALYAKFYSDMPKEEYMAKVLPQTSTESGYTEETPVIDSEPVLEQGAGADKGQDEQEDDYEVTIPVQAENGRKYKVKMMKSEAMRRFADYLMLEGGNAQG